MNKTLPAEWIVATLVLAVFWLLDTYAWMLFDLATDEPTGVVYLAALAGFRWLPWLIGPLLVAAILFGPRSAAASLGLDRSVFVGIAFGVVVTLPNLAIFVAMLPFKVPDDLARQVLQYSVLPGVFEETLYRAFLFDFLFRFAGWGFLPAALACAVLFGGAHIWQGGYPLEAAGIFAITAFGGLLFARLYAEWNFNIWIPAAVHVLMNLCYLFFTIPETGAGQTAPLIGRVIVILTAVGLTLWVAHQRGGKLIKGRVWLQGLPAEQREFATSSA